MSNKLVSAIIVTAGKNNYFPRCLDSLRTQTHPCLEIIVIDNSLSHDFAKAISRNSRDIKLYSAPSNLFYSRALNKGIESCSGDFILCLNDDVVLENNFIEQALRGFDRDRSIGSVSGKILRVDKVTLDSTGLFLSYCRTARERGYGVKDNGRFEKEEYIFGVNGAAAFYRKEMLAEIREGQDYFDSNLRIFYEDLDIAWRAKRKGWKGYYIPGAIAYHARGGTVRQQNGIGKPYSRRYLSDELLAELIKNRYLAMLKNEKLMDLIPHLPGIIFYDCVMWGYCLLFRPKTAKFLIFNFKYLNQEIKKRILNEKISRGHTEKP